MKVFWNTRKSKEEIFIRTEKEKALEGKHVIPETGIPHIALPLHSPHSPYKVFSVVGKSHVLHHCDSYCSHVVS